MLGKKTVDDRGLLNEALVVLSSAGGLALAGCLVCGLGSGSPDSERAGGCSRSSAGSGGSAALLPSACTPSGIERDGTAGIGRFPAAAGAAGSGMTGFTAGGAVRAGTGIGIGAGTGTGAKVGGM